MNSKKASSVAIITVNWNGYHHTFQCLNSLRDLQYRDFSVLVVDNGSMDGSAEKLETEFPEAVFLKNNTNLGFTGGNNAGIRYAIKHDFDFVLLLNNDATVQHDIIEKLIATYVANPDAGIIQPLILFQEDQEKIWSAGGTYNSILGTANTLGDRKNIRDFTVKNRNLDWATGCCMFIPTEVLRKTGLFQPSYFAYFEDVDLSLRMRKNGYKIILAAECRVLHEGSGSSKKKSKEGILSPVVFYLHARNQLFQLRRHHSFPTTLLAWPYHLLKYLSWLSYFCLRGRFQKMKALAKGFHDGFTLDHRSEEPLCP